MNNLIYPCIWMDGTAREAAGFYSGIFPATKITADAGIVTTIECSGQKMMLLNAGPQFQPNPSVSFLIANESEAETERLYTALAEGGIALMPLDSYPFSKKYGWVKDRFGITWQLYTGEKGNTDQYFTPTLMFVNQQNGRAKEAIAFYTSLFPNSKTEGIMEYPQGGEDTAGNVQHAQFSINNYTMACMDSSLAHQFNFDEGISIVVECSTQQEIDKYWNTLTADGGAESRCGWLKDKFGLSWQIVPVQLGQLMGKGEPEKSQRMMNALMQMDKLDIAALEAAYNGK
ncbi:VOC family protein [Niabella soli]|uniref:3-demethylubiquinone-9 3-methyltransferase n=1 Tax=Niabella soli DSM 19437 TaxID=929713 RepID=W0F2A6_9BACT|nr:VOC family protein [Niabella soli]AHF15466.1 3-demethylubiquinone-9 3-methyltransferase [Niabella soli DSM 19437]